MSLLIPVSQREIDDHLIPTCDARELHAFLKVGRDFSTWIKDRIEKYGFAEGVDYVVFTKSGENPSGGRPTTGYHLSLDMAKELAMVENNDRGRRARRYFIDCERRLHEGDARPAETETSQTLAIPKDDYIALMREQNALLRDKVRLLELQQNSQRRRRNLTPSECAAIDVRAARGENCGEIGRGIDRPAATIRSYLRRQRRQDYA